MNLSSTLVATAGGQRRPAPRASTRGIGAALGLTWRRWRLRQAAAALRRRAAVLAATQPSFAEDLAALAAQTEELADTCAGR